MSSATTQVAQQEFILMLFIDLAENLNKDNNSLGFATK